MIAMIEAARTTASPAEIWLVVVVAVSCLAFWLSMMTIASQDPGGVRRRRRVGEMQGPVVGGTHVSDCRRSVAPNRRSEAIFADHEAEVFGFGEPVPVGSNVPPGSNVTMRPRVGPDAAVPGPRPGEPAQQTPAMPAQRTGEADQPRRAGTGHDHGD